MTPQDRDEFGDSAEALIAEAGRLAERTVGIAR